MQCAISEVFEARHCEQRPGGFALRLNTPNGRVQWLQVIRLTGDEKAAARRWSTAALLELLLVPILDGSRLRGCHCSAIPRPESSS
ncbi:suppressor of fused domain protein [Variovorax paradoxus]|uniref:suppressor of fused domain protein n=1 Tax=Variovorax paradoxus TaxID=34073 RepID=UPI003D64C67E